MKTFETKVVNWIESVLYPEKVKEVKTNIVTDYLALRYERILRLRELARSEASRCVREGQPYNVYKLNQADHLLKEITDRLNARPIFQNRFNLN